MDPAGWPGRYISTAIGGAPQEAPGLRPWPNMAAEDAMSEEGESKAEPMVEDVSVVDAEPMDGARCGARLVLSRRQRAPSTLKRDLQPLVCLTREILSLRSGSGAARGRHY